MATATDGNFAEKLQKGFSSWDAVWGEDLNKKKSQIR